MLTRYAAALALTTTLSLSTFTMAAEPPAVVPFAFDAKKAPARSTRPGPVLNNVLKAIGELAGGKWVVGGVPLRPGETLSEMSREGNKDVLRIHAKAFAVGQTFVGYPLATDEIKPTYNYVSILVKSTKSPVQLDVALSPRTGLEVAQPRVAVTVRPGEWQRIVLPYAQFGLKSGASVKMIGLGVDATVTDNSDVLVAEIALGGTAYTTEVLKNQRTAISLNGLWRFAADEGEKGIAEKWNAESFDDSSWRPLKSGLSWEDQGVKHAGWGWYRQKIVIPKESAGAALSIALAEYAYEDDVYFNGERIGGLLGNYKYYNHILRTYSVPPNLVKYGQENTIAVRMWGIGGGSASPSKAGLVAGTDPKQTYYVAELDPYAARLRMPGSVNTEVAPDDFDLSDAQQGMAFDVVLRFPKEVLKNGGDATLRYTITDFYGDILANGTSPMAMGSDGMAQSVVAVDHETSKTVYLRGRFKVFAVVTDAAGMPIASDAREIDRLSFAKRDERSLPPLAETIEETPYGKLKLIDEIDCAADIAAGPHPYMQSGFDHAQNRMTPGTKIDMPINEILGKKAREPGRGFFAYRIGRGKLKVHGNYLLRIEYPEDKPRYAPIEVQNGHNFIDVGWKNGVSANDPFDNWPLSGKWQWYDVIVSLDEETTGTAGVGGSSAEHGVWVYFMNKIKEGRYNIMWQGGPAIARMKLYEIDVEKNAPVINLPKGLPQRALMFDWERQADQPVEDIVRYAKLMGYNRVSPIMLKWAFMNYGPAMSGYETTVIDDHRYWVRRSAKADDANVVPAESGEGDAETGTEDNGAGTETTGGSTVAMAADSRKPSVHEEYLAATKKYGIGYVPRIEYGGSLDLPVEARAIGGDGEFAKPNRFAAWSANLLHPATWDDLSKTVDNYFKPFIKDNPQLMGMLWRIRSDRMQISYGRGDVELFCRETNTTLPADRTNVELAMWAASGTIGEKYANWWHAKRAALHGKLVEQLHGYRPDLTLYYYNWDADKFALSLRDMYTAATFVEVAGARFGLVPKVYERRVLDAQRNTADDYIRMIRSGQLTDWHGWGHDYGLQTELYKDMKGIQLLAPANSLHVADSGKYLNYFKTADGASVSNVVSYDENGSRTINPKYEGNMLTPGGPAFSMALELLSYFHTDARTLTYTVYTYGRGFADAHRRFAQAYLALPAIDSKDVDAADKDVKIRLYPSDAGTFIGVAYKGYADKTLTISLPGQWAANPMVKNLVTNETVTASAINGAIRFDVTSRPMELHAFVIDPK